jgi:hypothetical protein
MNGLRRIVESISLMIRILAVPIIAVIHVDEICRSEGKGSIRRKGV